MAMRIVRCDCNGTLAYVGLRMSEQRTGVLTPREVQQLQLSLQSRSIREVALTVCTIRGLAVEVKSILGDLFHDEVGIIRPC